MTPPIAIMLSWRCESPCGSDEVVLRLAYPTAT
jgi:hypothetical protein